MLSSSPPPQPKRPRVSVDEETDSCLTDSQKEFVRIKEQEFAVLEKLVASSSYSFQEEKYKISRGKIMACLEAPDGTKFSMEASTVNGENIGARLRNGAASERRRQKSQW